MAGISNADVFVGTLEQSTTVGAVLMAPVGTTLPDVDDMTPASVTIDAAFKGLGYLVEDGFDLGFDMSTETIKEHNLGVVRVVVSEANHSLTITCIQTNETVLGAAIGTEHVTTAAADTTHGKRFKAVFGAYLPDPQSWVIKLKDGNKRMLVVVPQGQVSEVGTVTVAATGAIGWQLTISCLQDATLGGDMYILHDDGTVTA